MKSIDVFIEHILAAINKIEKYIIDYDFDRFISDEKTHDAVVREIEIIGEATTHLVTEFKDKYPDVSWQDIKGMRNHLIHEYWDVNLEDIWQTVQEDLPVLKKILQPILESYH